MRLTRCSENTRSVAGEITDRTINLSESDSDWHHEEQN
jgi:hypothetical protein